MTSPTAQEVLRRVEALHAEPPERARVTLDFGRYPIPDIPYLTIVKWSLSSPEDWPVLAGRRAAMDPAAATRGLTDDELRRVVYDDLKRSFWRAPPNGVSLGWDDERMWLTVDWSPREPPTDAGGTFARLGLALKSSTVDLVGGQAASADAFRRAVSQTKGPPEAPRPAFRVDVRGLIVPADEERAKQLYESFKRTTNRAARITFSDEQLTIEFADHNAVIRSNVTEALAQLATLPEFGSVPTHSGAPPAGTRTYPTAQDGAEFRAIEHAFAVPGYRNHRQAQRRELTTGLSYDVIARAFQKYDAAFTPEHLAHLDLALQIASTPGGSYQQAFTELFQHGGLVIGEAHSLPDAFQFVTRHMADMKAAGMTRLVCEAFPQEFQEELDRFVFGADGIMDGALEDWVRVKDLNRAPLRSPRCHALSDLLCAARKNQVSVIAAEHSAAYLSFGAGRIADPDAAELYDQEKRNGLYNWVAINRKPGNNTTIVPSVDVHITGAAHANTTENGCPGIAQLAGYAAVCVARRDDRSLFLERAREDRSMRPTGIPAHTAISPTSTVAAHPQHKTQRARSLTL